MTQVRYTQTLSVSDFEKRMISDFRKILSNGYGHIKAVVHSNRLTEYEPVVMLDNRIKNVQEAT